MGEKSIFSARVLIWMAAVIAVVVAGCAQTSGTVRGVVSSVEGPLTEVAAFTILAEGAETRYVPSVEGEYAFPLSHLREHQRSGETVVVVWEERESVRYALIVGDG